MKIIKKFLFFIVLLLSVTSITSCGKKEDEVKKNNNVPTEAKSTEKQSSYARIDIDLSKMNDTMKIAQVNQIMQNPANYDGKVIKVKGNYKVYYSKETYQYYPSVVISDSTECCQQTLEFVLKGTPIYLNGYPEIGCGTIIIVGVFERYYEGNKMYVHLINTEIL